MIIGVDAGGTNVDAVAVDETGVAASAKAPSSDTPDRVREVLERLAEDLSDRKLNNVDRIVVSTTLVLNAAVQDRLPECTNILIPGPGLSPRLAFYGDQNLVLEGCVDHRGRITEEVGEVGNLEDPEVVSIVSKFSSHNPELEKKVSETLPHSDDRTALGNESGGRLGFPKKAATTVFNAKSKPVFHEFEDGVSDALDSLGIEASVYYLKGDAAMLSQESVLSTPCHTVRSGPAASTLGLLSLSGVEEAVCIDIGGTTTDITVVQDGFPLLNQGCSVEEAGLESYYEGVESIDLSVGGDTRVNEDGLTGKREGDAAAFGGEHPTPTDALHVLGEFEEGDEEAAEEALKELGDPTEVAESVVDEFVSKVVDGVECIQEDVDVENPPSKLVFGGVLAPYFAPRIGEELDAESIVPENADVAGAVGCASARVSVKTNVHIDSERGVKTVASTGPEKVEDVEEGAEFSDEEVEEIAKEEAVKAAVEAGGSADSEAEVIDSRKFNVVKQSWVKGQIIDASSQVIPGVDPVFDSPKPEKPNNETDNRGGDP